LNRLIKILIVLTLLITICIGILTRLSYTNNTANLKIMEKCKMNYMNDATFTIEATNAFNKVELSKLGIRKFDFDVIYSQSDTILEVQKLNSSQKHYSTLSKAKVIKIFKGKEFISDSKIQIYEPYFYYFVSKCLNNFNGYIPMKEEKNYFVFLKRRYKDNQYRNKKQKNTFVFTTKDILSKYPANEKIKNYNTKRTYSISDVENYDLVCDDKNLNSYVEIYNLALKKLK